MVKELTNQTKPNQLTRFPYGNRPHISLPATTHISSRTKSIVHNTVILAIDSSDIFSTYAQICLLQTCIQYRLPSYDIDPYRFISYIYIYMCTPSDVWMAAEDPGVLSVWFENIVECKIMFSNATRTYLRHSTIQLFICMAICHVHMNIIWIVEIDLPCFNFKDNFVFGKTNRHYIWSKCCLFVYTL